MHTVTQSPRSRKPQMTAAEARTFKHGVRVGSIVRLTMQVDDRKDRGEHPADCHCDPYADFYTFRRWKAQGVSIRKGSRGFKLPVILDNEPDDDQLDAETRPAHKPKPRFWTAVVFCRCQTCQPGQCAADAWPYIVTQPPAQQPADCEAA